MARTKQTARESTGGKAPAEAAGHQGGPEVGPGDRRGEEAAQVQARDGGAEGDAEVPEEHGAADLEVALPAAGAGDRPGLQDRSPVPEQRRRRPLLQEAAEAYLQEILILLFTAKFQHHPLQESEG
ncbi:hypothetical protein NL676_029743 [Syzygium grande]|nr:hypothetical protein NL676_029743 [Syzygium grande]